MMKNNYFARLRSCTKIILLTVLTVTSLSGNLKAQTIFTENFEAVATTAVLPNGGWSSFDVTAGNSIWGIGVSGCIITGTKSMFVCRASIANLCDYAPASTTNKIAYKTFASSGYQTLLLNFKWKCVGENIGATIYDYGKVCYSTNGTTWTDLAAVYQAQAATQTVTNLALPASLDNQGTVYLGFRWINDNSTKNIPGFVVDDITVTATALTGCLPPTGLTATGVTGSGATVSWTAPAPPPANGYEYVVSTSNIAPAGSGTPTASTSAAVSLSANTTYYLFVRSICGGGPGNSSWAGPYTFTTPCNAVTTIPYSQGFNTIGVYPACWTSSLVAGTNNWVVAANDGDFVFTPHSGAGMACKNWLSSGNSQALFVSAPINLNAQPSQGVRVNVWIYRNTNGVNADRIRVLANTAPNATGATQLIDVRTLITSAPAVPSPGWYNYTGDVPLSFNAASSFYIVFEGTTTSSTSSYSVGFDDFLLENQPLCNPPTGLTATGVTASGATVSWTPPAVPPGSGYEYVVSTSNIAPGGSGTPAAGTSAAVGGLSSNTTYYLFVRSICGGANGNSPWAGPYSFTTPCSAISSLPYNNSFDVVGSIPACWATALVTGTTNWDIVTDDGDFQFTPHSGAGMATKDWDGAASDALLISQPFNTSATPTVQNRVNVWIYRNDLGVNGDRVRFFVNNAPNVTGATLLIDVRTLITSAPVVATEGWYNYTADIPLSFNNSDFYIVAEGNTTGNINSYSVGFDDLMVEKLVCISGPTAPANASSACPSGSNTVLSWPSFGGASGYNVYFGATNPATTLVSPNQAGTTYNAGALVAGNTYYWSVVPVGPGGTSCSTWSFTVKAVPDPQASSNSPVCAGQSLSLFGNNNASGQSSGNSWSWSGPSFSSVLQNPTISGTTAANAGAYTLTVTNSLGCTSSSTHTVTVNPNPVLSIATQTNVSCNGLSDGEVDVDANTGASPYLFDLNGNNTLDGIYTGLAAGTYAVSVIDDNGCEATPINVTITEPELLTVSSGNNSPACTGAAINLTSTPGGGTSGYSYAWTGPNGPVNAVQNPTISSATLADDGQYDLQVTDAHGCTATSSTIVSVSPEATVNAGTNQGICAGSTATMAGSFGGGASSATWSSSGSGSFNNNNPNAVYTPSGADITAGSVLLTYTTDDPSGPCSSVNASMTLTISPVVTVSAGSNQTICSGITATMAGSFGGAASSATWSSSGSGSFNNNNPNAVYTPSGADVTAGSVILTYTTDDPDGPCSSDNASMTLTINAAPTAAISNFGNNNICLSQPATVTLAFTGTGPWNYTISDGSQIVNGSSSTTPVNVNITPTTQGTHNYTITAVSDFNCPAGGTSSGTATVFVSTAPPTNNVGTPAAPLEACNGTVSLVTVNTVNGQNIRYSWNTGTNAGAVLFSSNIGGPFSPGPFQTTTNQVYAQYGALAGSSGYNVCVQGVNGCGSTNNKCVWVRGIVSVPGTITPANPVACPNDIKSYTCGSSGGASVYSWTLSGSSTPITSGQGTTSVQVTFPAAFTSGQLCVTAALSCGGSSTSAPRCMTITNNPATPGAFTAGPAKVCPGATGVTFTVPAVTGATGYSWTTPAGTTITSGQNTTSITVNFPNPYTGAPPVCVSATSACGTSAARCKAVGSNIPGQPGSVTGPTTNICNSTVQYSISNVAGASTYNWTNPAGTTITSGQGSTTILLSVGSTFNSGQLTVIANTLLCTPGSSIPRTITINGKPNVPASITPNPVSWCNGGFVNFSAPIVTPAVNYNWAITQGTITAGQGTDNIDVTWGTGTGNVTVNATNTCGASSNRVQTFSSDCREEENELSAISNQLSVYPNPAHENVTFSVYEKEKTTFSLQLTDVSGRIVLSKTENGTAGLNTYNLDLTHLSKGVYLLEVISIADNRKAKIIVE